MTDKISVSMVGYYNTLPFLYGLKKNQVDYDLYLDIPSKCMDYFDAGRVDVALVPVATLLGRADYKIISDYCIGCEGEVETVCVYSNEPIHNLHKVFLDSDSRTSQLLVKILFAKHWYVNVEFEASDVGAISTSSLQSGEAVLKIGDKAFGEEGQYEYVYDLGEEWRKMTGLPFAFAVWIAKKDFSADKITQLNTDLGIGVHDIPKVLASNPEVADRVDLKEYFERYIDYHFDDAKKQAHDLFRKLAVLSSD